MHSAAVYTLAAIAIVATGAAIYFVDAGQVEDARLPNVNLGTGGSQMPAGSAQTGAFTVGSTVFRVGMPDPESEPRDRSFKGQGAEERRAGAASGPRDAGTD
ncbi:MAG: hypothetical protein NXH82_01280 [Rhodobacteraceae bacterium]|nr:hypothetical protein [Paracoccaceae bacterium]